MDSCGNPLFLTEYESMFSRDQYHTVLSMKKQLPPRMLLKNGSQALLATDPRKTRNALPRFHFVLLLLKLRTIKAKLTPSPLTGGHVGF